MAKNLDRRQNDATFKLVSGFRQPDGHRTVSCDADQKHRAGLREVCWLQASRRDTRTGVQFGWLELQPKGVKKPIRVLHVQDYGSSFTANSVACIPALS